jgi:phosphoglycolate phosphatase
VGAVRAYVGDGARQLVARILPQCSNADLDHALRTFLSHYETHLLDQTRLYPGVPRMLDAIRHAGATSSVLSNKPAALCRRLLDGLGVASYFAAILGGDSLPTRKPDPAGIYQLEESLGTPRSGMLMVGDSPIDRETARAAGVAFCGVAWGFASHALRSAGDLDLARTPAEILSRAGIAKGRRMATDEH